MQKRWTVAILGSSLLMAGLEASLRGHEALQVMQVHGQRQDLAAQLAALHADVVILNLEAPEARLLLDLLQADAGRPFLGLGIAGNSWPAHHSAS